MSPTSHIDPITTTRTATCHPSRPSRPTTSDGPHLSFPTGNRNTHLFLSVLFCFTKPPEVLPLSRGLAAQQVPLSSLAQRIALHGSILAWISKFPILIGLPLQSQVVPAWRETYLLWRPYWSPSQGIYGGQPDAAATAWCAGRGSIEDDAAKVSPRLVAPPSFDLHGGHAVLLVCTVRVCTSYQEG